MEKMCMPLVLCHMFPPEINTLEQESKEGKQNILNRMESLKLEEWGKYE